MQSAKSLYRADFDRFRHPGGLVRWPQILVWLVFAAAFTCIAQNERPQRGGGSTSGAPGQAPPDPVQTTQNGVKQNRQEKTGAADNDRKKLISNESTQLLAMAVALKSEVDKTNKDVLSLNVIRRADEIEKLAHTVKEKMKQTSGPG